MKDKLLQIRVDEDFLSKLEYLQNINGFKSTAETVRKIVEKEFRKKRNMTWRDEKATENQLRYISELQEFSEYVIPVFTGTTKGEASDYIDKWSKKAHETIVNAYESTRH